MTRLRPHRHCSKITARAAAAAVCVLNLALFTTDTIAQSLMALPEYRPINPITASRSGLGTSPYHARSDQWRAALMVEYASAAELDASGAGQYVLDLELYRVGATVSRDLDAAHFVRLRGGVFGAHAGIADPFFDMFHRWIRHRQHARDERPTNRFAYRAHVSDSLFVEYAPKPVGLSDVEVGIGRRMGGHLQSLLYATLPVPAAAGYGRGVPSINAVLTSYWLRGAAGFEASAGAGYTPRHGPLADLQRTVFTSASAGVRVRVLREHAVYASLFQHSAVNRGTPMRELRGGELTLEFGARLVHRNGAVWHIALVEDTRSTDGGIDLTVRLGSAW